MEDLRVVRCGVCRHVLMTYRAIDVYFLRIDLGSFGLSRVLVWRRKAYLYE